MSDLYFTCPQCKRTITAQEDMIGQAIACPACSNKIQVPQPQVRTASHVALQDVGVEINRGSSPLGIAALVMGILACLTCWIPVVGLLTIPLSLIGLFLAFIGLIMAAVSKKTGFAFPISGGLLCVIAVVIAFLSTSGFTKAVSAATAKAQKTNQSVVPKGKSVFTPTAQHVPSTSAAREIAKFTHPAPPAEQWTSAVNAVKQGDVQIRITDVSVGKTAVKDMFGRASESTEPNLSITVELSNLSAAKKMDYRTWRGSDFSFGEKHATLIDDNDNNYKRVGFGSSSTLVGGIQSIESIYPGKTVTDVLVYEVPVDAAKWLRLTLPAQNLQGDGMLRFEIPASMIRR